MKRLFTGILAMTTLLLSSCGSPTLSQKRVCNSYTINDPYNVECHLYVDGNDVVWVGKIDLWLVDKKITTNYWYEYSNGEHYLKVGIA